MMFSKYKIIFLGFSLLFYFSVSAQEKAKIDSLNNALSIMQSDTGKLNTLTRLAFSYIMVKKTSKADELVSEAYAFATENGLKITYRLQWAKAEVLFYKKDAAAAIELMQTVIGKISKLDNNNEFAKATNFLAWTYLYAGEFSKSIETFEEWGRQKFSYLIDNHKEGQYFLFNLKLEPSAVATLEHNFSLQESILRFLIINRDD